MKLYLIAFLLNFGIWGIFSSHANDICPDNETIIDYKARIKISFDDMELEMASVLSKKQDLILENLVSDCAEKLVGRGVDEELFQAGFPTLISSSAADIVIYSLENIFSEGEHKYFLKDNERIVAFLKHHIEEKNENFFMRLLYDLDKWRQIHDFVLAAKFSPETDSDLAEMKAQAYRAYNSLDFALHLPIWQGEERREQFTQLCLELECMLDVSQSCAPESFDSWEIKATYLAMQGNLLKTLYECNLLKDSHNSSEEVNLFSPAYFMSYALNFRKMGILNSNCDLRKQLKYIELQGLDGANNCSAINKIIDE